jgi:hypothetical protein
MKSRNNKENMVQMYNKKSEEFGKITGLKEG